MTPTSSESQISVPASSIGRLIGKGGATIKELELQTKCKVQIPRRDPTQATEVGTEGVTPVSVRCLKGAANPEESTRTEERCMRAVHLLCLEGLSLFDALAKADAEQNAQKLQDQERRQEQEMCMAVRRIQMNWNQFETEDIKAALCEACNDEDEAIDLLLAGYRAPCTDAEAPSSTSSSLDSSKLQKIEKPQPKEEFSALVLQKIEKPQQREDFPALVAKEKSFQNVQSSGFVLGRRSSTAWSAPARKAETLSVEEAFPGLPAPRPRPSTQRKVQKPSAGDARWTRRNLVGTHLCR